MDASWVGLVAAGVRSHSEGAKGMWLLPPRAWTTSGMRGCERFNETSPRRRPAGIAVVSPPPKACSTVEGFNNLVQSPSDAGKITVVEEAGVELSGELVE